MATFVAAPRPLGGHDDEPWPAIEVRDLTRRFGSAVVLDRLSLTVQPGERLGVYGPNGSGKTTLLRCLAGTLTPSGGEALVFGHRSGSWEGRRALGVSLGQERALYGRLSGYENLLFAARLRMPAGQVRRAVGAICEEMEMGAFIGLPVERYSSGMRGRLAVGRVLLGQPPILLLDEPTRSLDADASALVWSALERRPELTVIVASPRREELSWCPRVIELVRPDQLGAAGPAAVRAERADVPSLPSGPRPARVPTATAAVLALGRRDLAQKRAVRLALILDLVFGALNLVIYKFIGRVMHGGASGTVARAGGYFSYAAVGIAFFLVVQSATTGITRQIRDEVRSGTLELVAAQPIGTGSLAIGLAGFPFLFATLRALVYLLLAAALGLDVTHANWLGVIVMLMAAAPTVASIGIVLAAVALVLERGDVVGRLVDFGLAFLSGAYFPVSEFAPSIRRLTTVLPTRLALDGQRAALAGRSWWAAAGGLVAFDVVTLPLALLLFGVALRWAKRHGRLTRG
jgi:ABC-2 type transport system permease protein